MSAIGPTPQRCARQIRVPRQRPHPIIHIRNIDSLRRRIRARLQHLRLAENGVDGLILPYATHFGTAPTPMAGPAFGEWSESGRTPFADAKARFRQPTRDWQSERNRDAFETAWKSEFDA